MERLILLGGGGHCRSCIDVIELEAKYEIVGILDNKTLSGKKILDYEIIGTDDEINEFVNKGYEFLITVGQIKTSRIRRNISTLLEKNKARLATVISPRAYVSRHAGIGAGSIIMHDALINAAALIGEHCIINSKALVEHDAVIEDFCHISTSSVINGGVIIREGTFFGSNAVSRENSVTGENEFIKSGSIYKGIT